MKANEFQLLVDEYYEPLYRFAFSLAKTPEDAADLTQQTFATWAKKQHQIRDRKKVKSWLFTTLYRDFLGQKQKKQRLVMEEPELPDRLPDPVPEKYLHQIDSKILLSCLDEMDENYRAPLSLFYLEDVSYRDISEILDLPIGTVMSRLNRAKAQLRDRITEKFKKSDLISFPNLGTSSDQNE
ncbi:MAG: RNA polymerase sigma factor [Opitutales bacterium]|nr:RNA polymerase sigma factor [Opitutales bacterium]MCH8539992.1 RNA polymerase sigma factor [Opitutales bacterium]